MSKLRFLNIRIELALINISRKFDKDIFINNKDISVRTCVYNAFLNMASLTWIISF